MLIQEVCSSNEFFFIKMMGTVPIHLEGLKDQELYTKLEVHTSREQTKRKNKKRKGKWKGGHISQFQWQSFDVIHL
jgi:hypothetical protein